MHFRETHSYDVEISPSDKASCRECLAKISEGVPRVIHKFRTVATEGYLSREYYHMDCFFKAHPGAPAGFELTAEQQATFIAPEPDEGDKEVEAKRSEKPKRRRKKCLTLQSAEKRAREGKPLSNRQRAWLESVRDVVSAFSQWRRSAMRKKPGAGRARDKRARRDNDGEVEADGTAGSRKEKEGKEVEEDDGEGEEGEADD